MGCTRMFAGVLLVLSLAPCLALAADGGCGPEEPTLYLDSPGASGGRLETTVRTGEIIDVTAMLRTAYEDVGTISGFSISVRHDPSALGITEATFAGTDAESEVYWGFNVVEAADGDTEAGFIAGYVCTIRECYRFPPSRTSSLVRARYQVLEPPMSAGSSSRPAIVETIIEYHDGLVASGVDYYNNLTHRGENVIPCTEPLDLSLVIEPFLRGDSNHDGVLDISDPVTTLRAQFGGDTRIRCADAADTNDDGAVDISDAIYSFSYLFQGGPEPPAPFPEPGFDPTPDDLLCVSPPEEASFGG